MSNFLTSLKLSTAGFFTLLLFFLAIGCSTQTKDSNKERAIRNLKVFSKVYGYIKYYHPSDEAAELDWDSYAAYGAETVAKCETKEQLIETLFKLFRPVAPSIVFTDSGEGTTFDVSKIIPEKSEDYRQTFWQHSGVSFGMDANKGGPYKSSRVNAIIEKDDSYVTGMISQRKDAALLIGKKVKYRALARKSGDSTQTAYLRLQLEKSDGTSDLFSEPIKGNEWRSYEIIATVDSLSTIFKFGVALKGKGTVRFEQNEMFYFNKGEWIKIPLKNGNFQSKHIHDEAGKEKWFFEGFGYSGRVTKNPYKGINSAMLEYEGKTTERLGEKLFEERPEFGEIINKCIGQGLHVQIPLVLYSNEHGTYPNPSMEELDKLHSKLSDMPKEAENLSVRLGNIINLYNVFQHFYPYFEVVEIDWDGQLEKSLSRCFSDVSPEDHLITLQKMTSPLKDGHISVSVKGDKNWSTPSITWEWIEGQLVITNVFDKNLPLKIGDVVTHVEGKSTQEYFDEIYSRISAGTEGWLNYRAEKMSLMGEKGKDLTIKVDSKEISLVRDSYPHRPRTSIVDFEEIRDGVFFLNLNTMTMEDIKKHLPELEKANFIICDLRFRPNGNHGFISHLLKYDDTISSWMKIPRSIYPDRENTTYQNKGWMLPAKKPYLGDKQIVFLIDGSAISYAESFMGYIEGSNLATIVGQPTAGTNGDINKFELLGGFRVVWTGRKVVKHDGSTHHGVGIIPDIFVKKTINGLINGKDEFLERAIELTEQMDNDRQY